MVDDNTLIYSHQTKDDMKISALTIKPAALAILLAGMTISGCSKKDSKDPSRSELLASGSWKFSNAGIDANGDGVIDSPLPDGTIGECSQDDTFVFNTNGTGTADEGATKCDPADPQTVNFGWTLSNNDQNLTLTGFDFGGLDPTFAIKTLNNNKITLSQKVDIGLPVEINVLLEFSH